MSWPGWLLTWFTTWYVLHDVYSLIQWEAMGYSRSPYKLFGNLTFSLPILWNLCESSTMWKVSKYGIFSGTYFPVFGLNTERYSKRRDTPYFPVFSSNVGSYGLEKAPYLDTFLAVFHISNWWVWKYFSIKTFMKQATIILYL